MGNVISRQDMERVSESLHSDYDVSLEATMNYIYDAYGMMPSSKLNKLSRQLSVNDVYYLGRSKQDPIQYDIYGCESTLYAVPLTLECLTRGEVEFKKINRLSDVTGEPAIEDVTIATDEAMRRFEYGIEAFGDPPNQNDNSGGGIEDITQATNKAMQDSGLGGTGMGNNNDTAGGGMGPDSGANQAANDMGGDDMGMDGFDDMGGGEGEDPNGSPDMLDEDQDDKKDSDDEGTAAKKRIRRNLYKLHTIIKDNLDAMSSFTPAYEIGNSKKYYRVQNILNTEDTIILKIITEEINNLTVEDLMKKYTTLCNILDISTRYLQEFKAEYKQLAEKHQAKTRSKTAKYAESANPQQQQ